MGNSKSKQEEVSIDEEKYEKYKSMINCLREDSNQINGHDTMEAPWKANQKAKETKLKLPCGDVDQSERTLKAYEAQVNPQILVVGEHGLFKSSLCNVLLTQRGKKLSQPPFPHPGGEAVLGIKGDWQGNVELGKVTVINTPEDVLEEDIPNFFADVANYGYITSLVLVSNGRSPTFYNFSEAEHLRLMRDMFGDQIFQKLIVVFDGWSKDDEDKSRRGEKGITEEGKKKDFLRLLRCETGLKYEGEIPCYFLNTLDILLELDGWEEMDRDVQLFMKQAKAMSPYFIINQGGIHKTDVMDGMETFLKRVKDKEKKDKTSYGSDESLLAAIRFNLRQAEKKQVEDGCYH